MVGDVQQAATPAARALGWQPVVAKGSGEEEDPAVPGISISDMEQVMKAGAPEHFRNLVLSKGGRGQRTETELLVLSGIEKCRNVFVNDVLLGRLARRQIIESTAVLLRMLHESGVCMYAVSCISCFSYLIQTRIQCTAARAAISAARKLRKALGDSIKAMSVREIRGGSMEYLERL